MSQITAITIPNAPPRGGPEHTHFQPGNNLGRRGPLSKEAADHRRMIRKVLRELTPPAVVREIMATLVAAAKAGDMYAMKLYLDRNFPPGTKAETDDDDDDRKLDIHSLTEAQRLAWIAEVERSNRAKEAILAAGKDYDAAIRPGDGSAATETVEAVSGEVIG